MNSKNEAFTNLQNLSLWLKTTRRSLKLSQTALGQQAGLSRMPVYRLEAGQDISLASFLALLAALKQHMYLQPQPSGPLRATDLAKAFAHLHTDDEPTDNR